MIHKICYIHEGTAIYDHRFLEYLVKRRARIFNDASSGVWATKDYNRRFYESLEKEYELHKSLMKRKMELVLQHIPRGKHLLDVGCGTGELIDQVRDRFEKIVGLDICTEAVEFSRRKFLDAPHVTIIEANVENLPDFDHKFDVTTALDVLEHLKDPETALRRIRSSLSINGLLITTTPNWYDKIWSWMTKDKSHKTKHSSIGWRKLISRAGFRPVLERTVNFPVPNSDFLCRKLPLFGMCVMIKAVVSPTRANTQTTTHKKWAIRRSVQRDTFCTWL